MDNASSDGSVEYVRKEFLSVRIIESRKNLGFAKGNNLGIKEARGELIATLNNDTQISPRWLEGLVGAMNSDEKVGMCASKMLFMKDHGMINSTGICLSRSGTCWDRVYSSLIPDNTDQWKKSLVHVPERRFIEKACLKV